MKHHDHYPSSNELATEQDLLDAWDSLDAVPPGFFQLDEVTIIEIRALLESFSDEEPKNDVRDIKVSALIGDEIIDENLSIHRTTGHRATVLYLPPHSSETSWQTLLDRLHNNPAYLARQEQLAQIASNLRIFGLAASDDRRHRVTEVATAIASAVEEDSAGIHGNDGKLKVQDRTSLVEHSLEVEADAILERTARRIIETDFLTRDTPVDRETIPIADLNRLVSLAQRVA
jgi:hypothetical protein